MLRGLKSDAVYRNETVTKAPKVFQINNNIPSSIPSFAPDSKIGNAMERRFVEISNMVSGEIRRNTIKKTPVAKLNIKETRYAKINLIQAL